MRGVPSPKPGGFGPGPPASRARSRAHPSASDHPAYGLPPHSKCVVRPRQCTSTESEIEHDRLVVGRTLHIGPRLHDGAHDRARAPRATSSASSRSAPAPDDQVVAAGGEQIDVGAVRRKRGHRGRGRRIVEDPPPATRTADRAAAANRVGDGANARRLRGAPGAVVREPGSSGGSRRSRPAARPTSRCASTQSRGQEAARRVALGGVTHVARDRRARGSTATSIPRKSPPRRGAPPRNPRVRRARSASARCSTSWRRTTSASRRARTVASASSFAATSDGEGTSSSAPGGRSRSSASKRSWTFQVTIRSSVSARPSKALPAERRGEARSPLGGSRQRARAEASHAAPRCKHGAGARGRGGARPNERLPDPRIGVCL